MFNLKLYISELKKTLDAKQSPVRKNVFFYRVKNRTIGVLFHPPLIRVRYELIPDKDLSWTVKDLDPLHENVLLEIQKHWREKPFLFDPNESAKNMKLEDKYRNDVNVFRPLSKTVSISQSRYKSVSVQNRAVYINFPDYGLYTIARPPSKLAEVPSLYKSFQVKYEARLIGDSTSYRFVVDVSHVVRKKSPTNLGPSSSGKIKKE